MKVLITGAAGFIGAALSRALLATRQCEVIGIDSFDPYYDGELKKARLRSLGQLSGWTFICADFCEEAVVAEITRKHLPTHWVHLGARPGVLPSNRDRRPYQRSNLLGFSNLLDVASKYPPQHLLYASSSSVYAPIASAAISEDSPTDQPASFYGATKKCNEVMAHSFSSATGVPTTGLRFFSVYGPWGRPDMAPTIFASAIIRGAVVDLYNFGKNRRDFTFIDDIVDGILRFIWNSAHRPSLAGIYNIGNNRPVSTLDVLKIIETELGMAANVNLLPPRLGEAVETWANIDRARSAVGYNPKTTVENGLAVFVDWYRNYYKTGARSNLVFNSSLS